MKPSDIPLPKSWPTMVKSAVLQVISLAHYIMIYTRSWCANSRIARLRLKAKLELSDQEVALLTEELRIKDARTSRIPAHQRPHYSSTERMVILEIKAARSLNASNGVATSGIDCDIIAAGVMAVVPSSYTFPGTLAASVGTAGTCTVTKGTYSADASVIAIN